MNIYDLLQKNDLNQYSLSKKSGIPLSTVKKIVTGKHSIEKCTAKTVKLLSEALNCSMEELMQVTFREQPITNTTFSSKHEYYKQMLKNRKNVILSKESASQYLNLSNSNLDPSIYVYSCNNLPEPFVVEKVDNFKNLNYKIIDGVLVTDTNQTINDLLKDENSDQQTIYESLSTCYFKNNNSFDGLKIDKVNENRFEYFADGAKEYYDED